MVGTIQNGFDHLLHIPTLTVSAENKIIVVE
jgi:hypothetical protein